MGFVEIPLMCRGLDNGAEGGTDRNASGYGQGGTGSSALVSQHVIAAGSSGYHTSASLHVKRNYRVGGAEEPMPPLGARRG